MPLVPVGEAVVRFEIIGDSVPVGERIAFIVIIRQILGELIVHLKLEMLGELLLHPQGESSVQRFRRAFERGQLADAVLPIGP
jgi:hypothetical protein